MRQLKIDENQSSTQSGDVPALALLDPEEYIQLAVDILANHHSPEAESFEDEYEAFDDVKWMEFRRPWIAKWFAATAPLRHCE